MLARRSYICPPVMPVVLRIEGLRFLFYSNEGSPREPPHIQVLQDRDEAKFWPHPEVSLAYNDGFDARRLNRIQKLVERNRKYQNMLGMTISPEAVRFDADCMWVGLSDGRTIGVPLAWFPRLLHAPPEQRNACELSRRGMHWLAPDEDISVAGLLAERGDQTRVPPQAA